MGKRKFDEEKHLEILEKINHAKTIKELPNIQLSSLVNYTARLLKNLLGKEIDKEDAKKIVDLYVAGYRLIGEDDKVRKALTRVVSKVTDNPFKVEEETKKVISYFNNDIKLVSLVNEFVSKNNKIYEIIKREHLDIMKSISSASRISEMPKGLSISKITTYLSNNSVLSNGMEKIPASSFINLANILLNGSGVETVEVLDEVLKISDSYIKDHPSYNLNYIMFTSDLYNKICSLPKLLYYVEEVRYSMATQKLFMERKPIDVNVYWIQSKKSPIDGGNFYEIYISRSGNLLDLKSIIPEDEDIDDVEKYVREKSDSSFKRIGGIILNRDETIGNISVFKPNTGNVEITPEEKDAYDTLEVLNTQLNALTAAHQKDIDEFKAYQKSFEERSSKAQNLMGEISGKIDTVLKTLKNKNNSNKNAN